MAGKFTNNMLKVMDILSRNWYTTYSGIAFSYKAYNGSTPQIGPSDRTSVRDIFGMIAEAMNKMTTSYTAPFDPSFGYNLACTFLGYGSGDTEPTADDYNLESVISTLTGSGATQVITATGKQYTQVVTNETADTITVKEIGLYALFWSAEIPGLRPALLYREVLDAPVTLQPGQTNTFTVELVLI